MKAKKTFDRNRLREIVEYYGGDLRSFQGLRADTYEQAVAGESLEQLELVYSLIFTPGRDLNKVRKKCPPWPEHCRRGGQRPGRNTLDVVVNRFKTDSALERLVEGRKRVERFKRTAKTLAPREQTKLLDTLISTAGQEILEEKLDDTPVSKQLPTLDRLLTREKIAVRDREGKLKKNQLKLQARKLETEQEKKKAGKKEGQGTAVTKEEWEQMERDLKLL